MTENSVQQTRPHDATERAWLVWLGLPLMFIGCACLTVAVVELASNDSISAVAGIIGAPLAIVGFVLIGVQIRRG